MLPIWLAACCLSSKITFLCKEELVGLKQTRNGSREFSFYLGPKSQGSFCLHPKLVVCAGHAGIHGWHGLPNRLCLMVTLRISSRLPWYQWSAALQEARGCCNFSLSTWGYSIFLVFAPVCYLTLSVFCSPGCLMLVSGFVLQFFHEGHSMSSSMFGSTVKHTL